MGKSIKLIYQAERSHCCGQCCMAMVAGVSLEDAKKAVGKNGRTSTKDLQRGLIALGMRPRGGKLKAIYGDLSRLPETGILKTVAPWRRSGWHWVLKDRGKIYCPSRGLFTVAEYERITDRRTTSYLEIFTDGRPAPGGGSDDLVPQKGHVIAEHGSFETIGVDCPACDCHTKFDVDTGHLEHNFRAVCYVCHRDITSIVKTRLMEARGCQAIARIEQGPWPRFIDGLKGALYIQSVGRALRPTRKSLIIAEYQAYIITQRWINLLRPTTAMISQPHMSIHDETVWEK